MKIEFEIPDASSDERAIVASAILQLARNADVEIFFDPYGEFELSRVLINAGIPDDCFTEERLARKA